MSDCDAVRAELAAVTAQRDALIVYLHGLGWTVNGIAGVAGVSPGAVARIVADAHPGGPTPTRL